MLKFFLILAVSCLMLQHIAFAENGDSRYFKAVLQDEDGNELRLFGNIPNSKSENFDSTYKNDKIQKKIEMLDVYRYAFDGEVKNHPIKIFKKIGDGFALNENDIAVKLNKENSDLVRSQRNFINVAAKYKSILVFFKKQVMNDSLAKNLANPDLKKTIENSSYFAFYPQDTESMFH